MLTMYDAKITELIGLLNDVVTADTNKMYDNILDIDISRVAMRQVPEWAISLGAFEISLRAWPRCSTNDIIPTPDDYEVIKPATTATDHELANRVTRIVVYTLRCL